MSANVQLSYCTAYQTCSPPSQTLLSPETFLNTVDVTQTRQDSLEVELTTLGEVGLGSVVVKFEKGRTTLNRGLDHTWRSNLSDSALVEALSESTEEEGTESHNRGGNFTTEFEMSEVSSDRSLSVL